MPSVIRKMINKPVYTKGGFYLGKVIDIDLNKNTQQVVHYIIKSSSVIKNILKKYLMVHRDQIVKITNKEIIVEDNAAKEMKKIIREEDFVVKAVQDIGGHVIEKE